MIGILSAMLFVAVFTPFDVPPGCTAEPAAVHSCSNCQFVRDSYMVPVPDSITYSMTDAETIHSPGVIRYNCTSTPIMVTAQENFKRPNGPPFQRATAGKEIWASTRCLSWAPSSG